MKKHILAGLALCAAAGAQAAPGQWKGFVGIAVTGGGETLTEVPYDNGDVQDIRSGGLVDVKGGFEWRQSGSPFALQGSLGYHVDRSSASNGSVRFERFPIELLGFWDVAPNLRLGAGLRYAANARLRASGAGLQFASNSDLSASGGVVLEGEYLFSPHFGLSLRAVGERYKFDNGAKADGDHLGVRFSYYF